MTGLTRRALITNGGVAVLGSSAILLAGCTPAPGGVGAPGGPDSRGQVPPAQMPVASPLPTGTELARVADIPAGGTAAVTVDGQDFLLAQPTEGDIVAFSAICTHEGCLVSAVADEFDCHCHGSRFEAATGNVLSGPARRPLDPVAVSVSAGLVTIA